MQPGLVSQHDFGVVRARYDLIVRGAVKDLQVANRAERVPAQVARIQRITIENNYLHERASRSLRPSRRRVRGVMRNFRFASPITNFGIDPMASRYKVLAGTIGCNTVTPRRKS